MTSRLFLACMWQSMANWSGRTGVRGKVRVLKVGPPWIYHKHLNWEKRLKLWRGLPVNIMVCGLHTDFDMKYTRSIHMIDRQKVRKTDPFGRVRQFPVLFYAETLKIVHFGLIVFRVFPVTLIPGPGPWT